MAITQHRQIGFPPDPPKWNLHGLTEADMRALLAHPPTAGFLNAAADALDELADERREGPGE